MSSPPTSPHALCTPSPAWFTAWVAGASQGLPCGSPVMTLITQVSGRQGEARPQGPHSDGTLPAHLGPFLILYESGAQAGRRVGGEELALGQLASGERRES